jgi:hypothetical protein
MLAGALIGAVLVHAHSYYPLVIALVAIVIGAAASHVLGRPGPDRVRAAA